MIGGTPWFIQTLIAVQFGESGRVKGAAARAHEHMNDEQRNFRPDQPKAETELSADQHKRKSSQLKTKCCALCSIQSRTTSPLKIWKGAIFSTIAPTAHSSAQRIPRM